MRLGKQKFSLSALAVLGGTAAVLLAGCGSTNNSGNGPGNLKKDQILHMAWATGGSTTINPLDPGTTSDSQSLPIVDLIYDGLVTLDANLKPELWGADKMTVSPDGLTYTFHLRPGQSFSDGTPVKASDFAYGITRAIDPCFQSGTNYYLGGVLAGAGAYLAASNCVNGQAKTPLPSDTVVADDGAATLSLKLTQPAAYFLDVLSYPTSFAIERSVVTGATFGQDETWTQSIVASSAHPTGQGGSGMFYVDKYDQLGNLVLKVNPHWWGLNAGKKPYLTEIDYKLFADGDTEYQAYNTGTQFDTVDGIPATQVAAAKSQPDFHQVTTLAMGQFLMNWKVAPFDDVRARRAFCEVINRDDVVNNVLKGNAIPSYHLVPQGMPGYNPNLTMADGITSTSGDLAKAQGNWNAYKADMKAQGKTIPPIAFETNINSDTAQAFWDKMVAYWGQLDGVSVKINKVTFSKLLDDRGTFKLQFYRAGWIADYPDPQDWLTLLYDSHSTYNDANISDPTADALMESADKETDATKRMQMYNQAEQELANQVAVCPYDQGITQYRVRTTVHNYNLNAQLLNSLDNWAKAYVTNS